MDQHQEVLEIDVNEFAELKRIAGEHGVEVKQIEVRGLELVTMTLALVVGSRLAVSTVLQAMDFWRGGQVIDRRPGAERVMFRSRDLRHDLMLILTPGGNVKIQYLLSGKSPMEALEPLAKKILALRSADTEAIVKTAKLELGSDALITTSSGDDATASRTEL